MQRISQKQSWHTNIVKIPNNELKESSNNSHSYKIKSWKRPVDVPKRRPMDVPIWSPV